MSMSSAVLRVALGLGGYGAWCYYLVQHAPQPFGLITIVTTAIVPALIAIPGLFTLFSGFVKLSRDQPLERWQGRYYAFDGYQVRILEEDGTVWIALKDALRHARIQEHDPEIERLGGDALIMHDEIRTRTISAEALLKLLERRNYREANKFRLWLERDVLPPIHRKRTGQRVPYTMGREPGASPADQQGVAK